MRNLVLPCSLLLLLATGVPAMAQKKMPEERMPKNGTKATLVRLANLYVQPDESADRVAQVTPGREMVIAERSGHWVRVFANIDAPDSRKADMPVLDQGAEII